MWVKTTLAGVSHRARPMSLGPERRPIAMSTFLMLPGAGGAGWLWHRVAQRLREEADIAFEEPCPFARWPDVPTPVLAGRDDRFFPVEFQNRVARERLGLGAIVLPGGHLNAISQPDAVPAALLSAPAERVR